jgi:hypothetical protein
MGDEVAATVQEQPFDGHEQLEHIHKEMSRVPVTAMTPRARTLLTRACHEVSTIFSSERGAATAEAERKV